MNDLKRLFSSSTNTTQLPLTPNLQHFNTFVQNARLSSAHSGAHRRSSCPVSSLACLQPPCQCHRGLQGLQLRQPRNLAQCSSRTRWWRRYHWTSGQRRVPPACRPERPRQVTSHVKVSKFSANTQQPRILSPSTSTRKPLLPARIHPRSWLPAAIR